MESQIEKGKCDLWFQECRSVDRRFLSVWTGMLTHMWHKLFNQVSSICKGRHPRRQSVFATWTCWRNSSHLFWKKRGPNDMLFHKVRVPPKFHKEVMNFMNWMFPGKRSGRDGPIVRPPHSLDLTRHEEWCMYYHVLPLWWYLLAGWNLQWLQLPSPICHLKLNEDMISATQLTVPSLYMRKM